MIFGVPLPRWLARANKAGLNRVMRHAAPWAPTLALVVHTGRKSGRRYETPVMVFRDRDEFVIALTYGADNTQWVKNVLAANEADVLFGNRTVHIVNPRIVPAGGDVDGLPFMARVQARKMGVLVADIA